MSLTLITFEIKNNNNKSVFIVQTFGRKKIYRLPLDLD